MPKAKPTPSKRVGRADLPERGRDAWAKSFASRGGLTVGQAKRVLTCAFAKLEEAWRTPGLVRRREREQRARLALDRLTPIWSRLDALVDDLMVERDLQLLERVDRLLAGIQPDTFALYHADRPGRRTAGGPRRLSRTDVGYQAIVKARDEIRTLALENPATAVRRLRDAEDHANRPAFDAAHRVWQKEYDKLCAHHRRIVAAQRRAIKPAREALEATRPSRLAFPSLTDYADALVEWEGKLDELAQPLEEAIEGCAQAERQHVGREPKPPRAESDIHRFTSADMRAHLADLRAALEEAGQDAITASALPPRQPSGRGRPPAVWRTDLAKVMAELVAKDVRPARAAKQIAEILCDVWCRVESRATLIALLLDQETDPFLYGGADPPQVVNAAQFQALWGLDVKGRPTSEPAPSIERGDSLELRVDVIAQRIEKLPRGRKSRRRRAGEPPASGTVSRTVARSNPKPPTPRKRGKPTRALKRNK